MAKKNNNQGDGGEDVNKLPSTDVESRLGRSQSVRFMGPTAVPTRNRSITRREVPDYRTSDNSQLHCAESSTVTTKIPMTNIPHPLEEFGESDIASVPSSYRKIQKAKSMFSLGKSPSAVFSDGTPKSKRHFQRHSMHSSESHSETLRTPHPRLQKSFSFVRGIADIIPTRSRQYVTQDAAVQLARDHYIHDVEQQRLKEEPSFLNLVKRRQSHKQFRRTVRSSSTNSYGSAIASPLATVTRAKSKGLKHKARSISLNLKTAIKCLFRRPPEEDTTLPVQQLDASHAHYGDYITTSDGKQQRYPPVPEPDAELLRRVGSRELVTRAAPAFVDKDARPGSIRSVGSGDDEKSRVTSWTNSTAANTIHIAPLLERKRLSIIKEDGGPHQPSSSARQFPDLGEGYAKFRQPVRQNSANLVNGLPEPERVFSALQKEIVERNRRAAHDDSELGTESGSDQTRSQRSIATPTRTSSVRKNTDRSVAQRRGMKISDSSSFSPSNEYLKENQPSSGLGEGLTPQQIAEMNESGLPLAKRPLREVKSTFFPSSMRLERSTTSPYRRAMHSGSEDETGIEAGIESGDRYQLVDPTDISSSRLCNGNGTRSESIYSRTPGGHTPKAIGSSTSLLSSGSSGEAGTAIIITSRTAKHEQSDGALVQRRYSSSRSSGDWKNWMAGEMAYLQHYEPEQDQIYNAVPVKESGHRKENAQLDSEDVSIGNSTTVSGARNQPLGIIRNEAIVRPSVKHRASRPVLERLASIENDLAGNKGKIRQQIKCCHCGYVNPNTASECACGHVFCRLCGAHRFRALTTDQHAEIDAYHNEGETSNQNENVPLSRLSVHSRKASNPENGKISFNRMCEPSGVLRERSSQASISSREPAKSTNSRCSPERTERLRRLKSSSSTSMRRAVGSRAHRAHNENHATHMSSPANSSQPDDDGDCRLSLQMTNGQAAADQQMVDGFLKSLRREMKISEENASDPAFL